VATCAAGSRNRKIVIPSKARNPQSRDEPRASSDTGADGEFPDFLQPPHVTLTTSSTLRFPSREHVEALITRSGLAVRDVFGDWDASPFDPASSREIIFIAEIAG
jgi:hypothetical protein